MSHIISVDKVTGGYMLGDPGTGVPFLIGLGTLLHNVQTGSGDHP
jgi:hypothetical protein